MTTLRLDWEQPDRLGRDGWESLLSRCPRANAFQSWSGGEAHAAAHGYGVARAIALAGAHERPIGAVQVFERPFLGLFTFAQVLRGPIFTGGVETATAMPAVLRALRRRYRPTRGAVLALMPELDAGPVAERFLRDAGFFRIKTGYRSAWLDLTRSERSLRRGLRQNFRNQLRKAEGAGLEIAEGDAGDRDRIVDRHMAHRRRRGYAGPSPAVLKALPLAETPVFLARTGAGHEAAAVLFLRHGANATYQIGWTTEEGRATHAHNLLLWRGLGALKRMEVARLDLGGLDDTDAPGAAHFKQGLGGEPFTLAGTFV